MIITLDGPAGSGKSTVARLLAERLGFERLDTGAGYRAIALAVQRSRVPPQDTPRLRTLLRTLQLEMRRGAMFLNGEDVSPLIRTPEISDLASSLAVLAEVRECCNNWQRRHAAMHAATRGLVTDGRDQGTAVFPNADCKFYLTADAEERARRRFAELQASGQSTTLEEVRRVMETRDRRDRERQLDPLSAAADALRVDTTGLTVAEVVARLESFVRHKQTGQRASVTLAELTGASA
jgi:cytidylate kinase